MCARVCVCVCVCVCEKGVKGVRGVATSNDASCVIFFEGRCAAHYKSLLMIIEMRGFFFFAGAGFVTQQLLLLPAPAQGLCNAQVLRILTKKIKKKNSLLMS